MRREVEELKALVCGLCAKKDVEPSFDQENVPTLDQHNSFKASCSIQEKQPGVSDPPTMPVDNQKCKLYIFDELHGGQLLVAFGRAWLECLPTDIVHRIPLAWPKSLVELDTSMNKGIRGPSHVPDQAAEGNKRQKNLGKKLINSRTEVQQDAQQHKALFDFNKMNMEMRPLAYYAHSSMREVNQIEIFGGTIYLEELCRINRRAEKFVFVSSTLISPVRVDTPDAGLRERADALVFFLCDAPKERLYLVPHNRGRHWVFGVIDPWEDLVLYFDPLREKKRDDFTNLMNMALMDWKLLTREGIRKRRDYKTKISDRPCPLQEGSIECGYFVLGENGLAM
ncbi:hypothetical protein TIFTF001_036112 [Ficus carica]|uniref:Ubiquitin-like protease family profile domain-containing protein n=1 Tax=Ficus carica TaxID=3494 RepID=A0AA88E2Q6_FICCA|nr:hypothetical protein TIFTF001_036112 [Ficus carica]